MTSFLARLSRGVLTRIDAFSARLRHYITRPPCASCQLTQLSARARKRETESIMAMSAATLEEIEGVKVSPTQQTRMFESSYNGSAAAGSAVPYDLWSSCSESEAADIPMIVPPPSLDSSNPTPPAKKKLKVTFSETIRICESASNQDSYQSPNLNSQHLQQKVLLAKAASHLRAQLQVYYRQGRLLNLTKRDIDDHVLPYCFDGLGGKLV